MKNTALFFALVVSMGFSTNILADAVESGNQINPEAAQSKSLVELEKTAIDLWAYIPFDLAELYTPPFWAGFKWRHHDDDTVSLWPVSNDKFIDPYELHWNLLAFTSYTITVRDEDYKIKSEETFATGAYMTGIANYLTKQKLRLGKDSIQITYGASSSYYVRVEGKVESVTNINFFLPDKWQIDNYSLVPRKDGLYASYIHQNKIDDHQYRIGNSGKYLMTDLYGASPVNVILGRDPQQEKNSTWQVTYDQNKFAYRIEISTPTIGKSSLAWNPSSGRNVFVYQKSDNPNQYWYVQKSKTADTYEITSAYDVTKHLNVDADLRNISVANEQEGTEIYRQRFSLEKTNELQMAGMSLDARN